MPETPTDPTRGRELLSALPHPLPAARIAELNRPRGDLRSHREYEWNGRTFPVPPGVFLPGQTSRMIFDRILDGSIPVRDRHYVAMGAGLGVEAVAAADAGARDVHVVDVHPGSVAAAEHTFARHVAPGCPTTLVPVVGDLFDGVPDDVAVDVVTFNPPAVSVPVSDDPDVVRNVCQGTSLLERFFAQLGEREAVTADTEVFVVASTTADLRGIVGHAIEHGFVPEVRALHDWQDGVVTHLFRFIREDAS